MQLVRSVVDATDPANLVEDLGLGAAEIAQIVPEVRARFPELEPPIRLDPEQERFRAFESITQFLMRAAGRRPLVLVIDDLHWADPASARLLHFAARHLGEQRLLLVCTYRDTEIRAGHVLHERLLEIRREPATRALALEGLSLDEAREWMASALDPGFARAHAGLSFVHFQTAFMHYTHDLAGALGEARRFAERGLELDPLDPFVNFTMGRSYWLEGDLDTSLGWLERSTSLSPNYAQGIYARAWTAALAGRALEARQHVDLAMRLSPLDPLYYAMQATRAFTHMVQGEEAEAAHWAERAARSPGAARPDRDGRGRGARPAGRRRARRVLGGERPRAERRAHPRRLLPRVPYEARADAGAAPSGAGPGRALSGLGTHPGSSW
jgi:tetratricopeptide (TPR) repeat protein